MGRARRTTGQEQRGGLERAQFLAALSHELRTPLNSILGFTQVLLSGMDGPLTPGQREDLEAIASAGEYLSALVREVLDTSAETTGELEVFGLVDLGAVAEDAARLFTPQVKKTQHELVVSRAEPVPKPLGSPRAVRQVLLNLIGNAAKHGKPGPIHVSAFARGDVAVLAVTNVGRSVLTAREAPFRPFERGVDGRGDPEGWGLGLAIADELAARMGGAIEMQSGETAKGPVTTFALLLPLARGVRLRELPSTHAMPTRTHFVAAMSHELRAPLGAIAGFSSLLEDEVDGPLTPAQKQSVTRIRRSAESLVASLTDILDVARADVGRLQLAVGPSGFAHRSLEIHRAVGFTHVAHQRADRLSPAQRVDAQTIIFKQSADVRDQLLLGGAMNRWISAVSHLASSTHQNAIERVWPGPDEPTGTSSPAQTTPTRPPRG